MLALVEGKARDSREVGVRSKGNSIFQISGC